MKMALPATDLLIFSWPSNRPASIGWDRMTGFLRPVLPAYSRASTLTLRWSMPSWQMSAWPTTNTPRNARSHPPRPPARE